MSVFEGLGEDKDVRQDGEEDVGMYIGDVKVNVKSLY